jgi:hypothetical protein
MTATAYSQRLFEPGRPVHSSYAVIGVHAATLLSAKTSNTNERTRRSVDMGFGLV